MFSVIIFGLACITFITFWGTKSSFGEVGENMTLNLRSDLYTHILKMHIGWHDDPSNSGGVLTAILAKDI